MASQFSFGADLARDARHFRSKRAQLIDHGVDRVFELENFATNTNGDFLGKVAISHRGRDVGNIPDLAGKISRHRVHRIGQILPRAGHSLHLGLAAKFSFGTDFTRHARHFRGK